MPVQPNELQRLELQLLERYRAELSRAHADEADAQERISRFQRGVDGLVAVLGDLAQDANAEADASTESDSVSTPSASPRGEAAVKRVLVERGPEGATAAALTQIL